MEHLWANALSLTPETLKQVTDNPERALQAGQHIHRTLFIRCFVYSTFLLLFVIKF